MSRAATRLRALERRRPAARQFVIVSQDAEQPGQYTGPGGERYTEQQLAALPAGTTVIIVSYADEQAASGQG